MIVLLFIIRNAVVSSKQGDHHVDWVASAASVSDDTGHRDEDLADGASSKEQ